jgi:hypothetical protein
VLLLVYLRVRMSGWYDRVWFVVTLATHTHTGPLQSRIKITDHMSYHDEQRGTLKLKEKRSKV